VVIASVAVTMTILALNYGGYGTDTVSVLAFVSWGVILAGLGFGFLPRTKLSAMALVTLGLMAALTAYSALAIAWSDDAGLAFIRMLQIATASGIFTVVVLFSKPGEGSSWIWGLTLGFAAIVALAAISRFFPGIGDDADLTRQLGTIIGGRLSWPIGYWNALGIATACLLVLCVWHGGHAAARWARLAASAAIPFAAVVMYLCSSRGSLVATVCGLAVVIGLGPRRRRLAGTLLIGLIGSAPLVILAANLSEVVHAGEGSDALVQGLILLVATVAVALLTVYLRGPVIRWLEATNLNHRTSLRLVGLVAVLGVILVIASDPAERISAFTSVPWNGIEASDDSTFATNHLLSESGNGRWQLWESAINAFQSQPLRGIGSGGFEAWFKTDGSFWMKTIDPHSLPLQFLSELGLIGILLMFGTVGTALTAGIRRYRELGRSLNVEERDAERRPEMTAFLGLFVVGAFGFSIDWTGDIPVLYGPMMICLAALAGPIYAAVAAPATAGRERHPALRYAAIGATMIFCGAVMISAARQYEATRNIAASRESFENGDGKQALEQAQRAVSATPWAGAPYAQMAAVQEKVDDRGAALASAIEATERSPKNDSFWILRSDIQTRLGLTEPAFFSALTAKSLNPNSAYWSPLPPE